MPQHHRSALVFFLVAAAGAGASQAQAQAVPASAPPAAASAADTSGDVIQAGRKIFHGAGGCYACHGGKLQGGPVAPPLTGPTFKDIDGSFDAVLHVVRGGVPGTAMVAHPGGIDDAQTIQVANYVYAVIHGQAKP
jgi:mono/diheme cytochrome c family protein